MFALCECVCVFGCWGAFAFVTVTVEELNRVRDQLKLPAEVDWLNYSGIS